MISSERKEVISDLAEYISTRFFKPHEPILPELIAKKYNIGYCYGEYGDYFDGMLEHSDGEFHIFINTEKHNNQQRHRFSFAHELGHFFIDEHAIALAQGLSPGHCSATGFVSESIVEREADLFAACLLMPKTRVIDVYRSHRKFSFSIIETLYKNFQVSISSALYRVFYLDLHPMMIVKITDSRIIGKPQRSRDFYYYLRDKSLPDDSGAYLYFKEGKEFRATRQLYAFDWFRTESHKKIYEHNIYYKSKNTVYSIIWAD